MSRPVLKRSKPGKRKFLKPLRLVHRARVTPGRLFKLRPDPKRREFVELHVCRTHVHMLETVRRYGKDPERHRTAAALCNSYVRKRRAPVQGQHPGHAKAGCVARIFVNVKDWHARPNEISAHESTHAAMAWARYRRADLRMPLKGSTCNDGEEVLAYAVGLLTQQCIWAYWAMKAAGAIR